MSVGPLRRLTGAVGLVALVPTAWLLATNAITLTDAAMRATATLIAVVAVGRVIGWVVGGLAGSFERDEHDGGAPAGESPTTAESAGQSAPRSAASEAQGLTAAR